MQLTAYDRGCGGGRQLANVIVSRDVPGSVSWWEWEDQEQTEREYRIFKTLLEGWQIRNNYEI